MNDLLDVARIEAGQIEIHRRLIDVVEAVREVATLIEPRIADKRQELDLEAARASCRRRSPIPRALRQIVTNLITNAHLYTPPRGQIAVAASRPRSTRSCSRVSDNGRGMTPEELEHVFDRFYRGADGRTVPGTGLGPVDREVARRPARRHDHRGEPSRRRARASPSGSRASRLAEGGPRAARGAARPASVLVVDDEPDIAELIAEHLEPYEVETDDRALGRARRSSACARSASTR